MRLFGQEPAALPQPLPSAERVSDVLRDIMADPDFATFDASARDRVIRWLFGKLVDAWNWLQRLVGEDGTGVAELVVIVVAVAALVAMVAVASRHAPRVLGHEPADDEGQEPAPATAREWLGIANRRAGEGAFRPAATALYQGFLLSLEQQGALSFHSSKTPGDYAREIAGGSAGSASAGSRFLASFQGYSFGQEEPTGAGYTDLTRMARDAGCPAEAPVREMQGTEAADR